MKACRFIGEGATGLHYMFVLWLCFALCENKKAADKKIHKVRVLYLFCTLDGLCENSGLDWLEDDQI
jgi:hypothetical protein